MPDLTALPRLPTLRASCDGEVILPDRPGYTQARGPVNPGTPDSHPSTVLRCRSVGDVVAGLDVVRTGDCSIAVRGGGHWLAGRSSTHGVLLDLAALDHLSVADDGTATIGAGARLGAVCAGLHGHGRTLAAGRGPSVGSAGLTLGGGIGLLCRIHGLRPGICSTTSWAPAAPSSGSGTTPRRTARSIHPRRPPEREGAAARAVGVLRPCNVVVHGSGTGAACSPGPLRHGVVSPSPRWVVPTTTSLNMPRRSPTTASGSCWSTWARLPRWAQGYHAGNHPRLVAVEQDYDPHRLVDFPQAI